MDVAILSILNPYTHTIMTFSIWILNQNLRRKGIGHSDVFFNTFLNFQRSSYRNSIKTECSIFHLWLCDEPVLHRLIYVSVCCIVSRTVWGSLEAVILLEEVWQWQWPSRFKHSTHAILSYPLSLPHESTCKLSATALSLSLPVCLACFPPQ